MNPCLSLPTIGEAAELSHSLLINEVVKRHDISTHQYVSSWAGDACTVDGDLFRVAPHLALYQSARDSLSAVQSIRFTRRALPEWRRYKKQLSVRIDRAKCDALTYLALLDMGLMDEGMLPDTPEDVALAIQGLSDGLMQYIEGSSQHESGLVLHVTSLDQSAGMREFIDDQMVLHVEATEPFSVDMSAIRALTQDERALVDIVDGLCSYLADAGNINDLTSSDFGLTEYLHEQYQYGYEQAIGTFGALAPDELVAAMLDDDPDHWEGVMECDRDHFIHTITLGRNYQLYDHTAPRHTRTVEELSHHINAVTPTVESQRLMLLLREICEHLTTLQSLKLHSFEWVEQDESRPVLECALLCKTPESRYLADILNEESWNSCCPYEEGNLLLSTEGLVKALRYWQSVVKSRHLIKQLEAEIDNYVNRK